jgi:hypothetical protein
VRDHDRLGRRSGTGGEGSSAALEWRDRRHEHEEGKRKALHNLSGLGAHR